MDCMTIKATSEKCGISPQRIQVLCRQRRIAGAVRISDRTWAVPADTEKPKDARIKSGKYIKLKRKG